MNSENEGLKKQIEDLTQQLEECKRQLLASEDLRQADIVKANFAREAILESEKNIESFLTPQEIPL